MNKIHLNLTSPVLAPNWNPSGTPEIEIQSSPAHPNQDWTQYLVDTSLHRTPRFSGHLISSRSNFVCCDFGRLGTNVLLSIYPILSLSSLPARFALYKLHFVTVCPSWNAFLMVFGLLTPSTWSHNPSPCPPCCPLIASQAANLLATCLEIKIALAPASIPKLSKGTRKGRSWS